MREAGSGTRAAMERFFNEHGIQLGTGSELETNEAIKQAVQAGLGLGVISARTIELELEAGRLAVLPVEGFPILRHWYVVRRAQKRLSAAAQAFRAHLLAQPASASAAPERAARRGRPTGREPGREEQSSRDWRSACQTPGRTASAAWTPANTNTRPGFPDRGVAPAGIRCQMKRRRGVTAIRWCSGSRTPG